MKVLFVTTSYPRFSGDYPGKFIHTLACALAEKGNAISVVAPSYKGAKVCELMDGVKVRRFRYAPSGLEGLAYGEGIIANLRRNPLLILEIPFFLASFAFATVREIRGCDVVHAHWLPSGFVAAIASALGRKPLVLTVHGSDLRTTPKAISRLSLTQADIIISPHPEMTELVKKLGFNAVEVPNPVDLKVLCSGERDRVRSEFRLGDKFMVLFMARLDEFKDPLTFIRAASAVKNDMRFLVVGDGPLRREAEKTVADLGLVGKVSFTGFRSDVPDLLAACDVFSALSPKENIWSVSLVEAMTAGKPCVVTRSGRTEAYLTHEDDAYLVKPQNPAETAEAFDKLYSDEALRALLSRNAKSSSLRFSADTVCEKMIKIYRSL